MDAADIVNTRRTKLAFRISAAVALAIVAIALWPILTTVNRLLVESRIAARAGELGASYTVSSDELTPWLTYMVELQFPEPLSPQDVELFRQAVALESLDLGGCNVTDRDVTRLVRGKTLLRKLDLSGSAISAAALAEIAALPNIDTLRLSDVPVSPPGLAHLAKLPKLKQLQLHECALSVAALQEIGRSSVVELDLYNCRLDEAGLAQLVNVQHLNLTLTNVTDDGVEQLARVAVLQSLDLELTKITGRSLAALRSLKLSSLVLDKTAIVDSDLQHLVGQSNLAHLSLEDCWISDAAIDDLLQLTKLETLMLHGTKVTDRGLLRLAALSKLAELHVSRGAITTEGLWKFAVARPDVRVTVEP